MPHILDVKRREFLALIEAGKTVSQISAELGVSKTHTKRFADLLGVVPRNGAVGPRVERMTLGKITADRVRELFLYDPLSGSLTWRMNKNYRARAGERAGSLHGDAKRQSRYVRVDGVKCHEHRVIWLHVTGAWPEGMVDHRNGDASDNRWANLRDVSAEVNAQNRRKPRAGARVGLLGVVIKKRCPIKPYTSSITVGGKRKGLGFFATAEEAHAAYVKAKREMHIGCTI